MTLNEAEQTLSSALNHLYQYGPQSDGEARKLICQTIDELRKERNRRLQAYFAQPDVACIGNGLYVRRGR